MSYDKYTGKIYQQTNDYDCEAASIMNLLRFYGVYQDKDLTQQTEQKVSNALGITGPSGADDSKKIAFLASLGFKASIVFGGTIANVDTLIASGHPIIPFCKLYGEHWLVYLGKDPTSGKLIFADSAYSSSKLRQMDQAAFEKLWYDDQYYTDRHNKIVHGIYLKVTK